MEPTNALADAAVSVFRQIIPTPEDRRPLTWSLLPGYLFVTYVPFVYLAYLARRPDTFYLRLFLLPSVLCCVLAGPYGYSWTIPSLNVYNWGQCLLANVLVSKSLEYALTPEGMLKIGESKPGYSKGKGTANGHAPGHTQQRRGILPSALADSFELIHTLRGLRWKFAQGTHIPAETRPQDKAGFLKATFLAFLGNFLVLDFAETLVKLLPGLGDPTGGSIFYQSLRPVPRYVVSTAIHITTGTALLAGFNFIYYLFTMIAVGLLDQPIEAWPPAMDNPWTVQSMHDFWAKRWHQFLRRTFVVLGGYPGYWIGGNVGMVIGVFLASGLYHETAIYSMGRGLDHTVTIFFTLQAGLLFLERAWRIVTGHRVGGWPGRLWVYLIMFVAAQPMVDSWHRRGLGGAMVIPPFLSPAKVIVPQLTKVLLDLVHRQD